MSGGFGRVFNIGSQAVNMRIEVMDNVPRPQYDLPWPLQLRSLAAAPRMIPLNRVIARKTRGPHYSDSP